MKLELEIKNLSFAYSRDENSEVDNSKEHENCVLKNINLNAKAGDVIVISGVSGCGKTTLLRAINGIVPKHYSGDISGSVSYGADFSDLEIYEISKLVGTVFQNPKNQFFNIVAENEMAFALENQGVDREIILKKIDIASENLNISHLLKRKLHKMSGGEKQRIACACVQVLNSEIIVLDEPSSNLDFENIELLADLIAKWKSSGKIIVISEHRLYYLKNVMDRLLYYENGNIVDLDFKNISLKELNNLGLRAIDLSSVQIDKNHFNPNSVNLEYHKLKDFKVKYDNLAALDIDEIDIPKGKIIGIIGKNGAGKSTFVQSLCGLLKNKSSKLNGMSQKERLKKSYLVFQDVTVQLFADSVYNELKISSKRISDEKILDILNEFGLSELREAHPNTLSGGQKQRLAIATAIISDKDILVFDEPTSGMDYKNMLIFSNAIKKLSESGKSVFIVTHDYELICNSCEYIIHLESGKLKDLYNLNNDHDKLREFFIK